ncbi:E3 ubiquitin-protein ligase Topors isoform X1 [Silurus meridionalis]|uniref:E3 ubiquitin-protein ligase Topors isoform X1 n=1 Tax=Silurus meridionalis TaxID=175797 RepID=UPI001EEA4AA2|nr:E3 ubiquitin-protein ligase Topors isoform X1 [Silurus meridionalis]
MTFDECLHDPAGCHFLFEMMAPTKMKLRVRKKEKGLAKSSQQQQPLCPETSPDSKCPICLDRFVNVASVERCLHRFCFRCIREWAKNKAECPLCKQPFRSIFHSVRAENDFKEYVVLEDNAQNATTSATVTMAAAAIAAAPAGQNDAESTATRTRRSRATRTRQRRSQRAQDPAPSASSMDGVALDATLMQRDPACLRQLLPWLRRERVMGANPSELRPFLLARTDHILHELVSFARSIEAMQCPPAPSYEEDSGSQSSIINISEDNDDSGEADVTEDVTQDRVPPVPMATSSEISLSQSAWDDETPGPSYSTLSHSQTEEVEPDGTQSGGTSAATEQRDSNNKEQDEEEECMIVGYVKPMAERTPELVQLSSDSTEEEVGGDEAAAMETVMKVELSVPTHEQVPVSPKSYPSTSHTERGENLEQSREKDTGKTSHHKRQERPPKTSPSLPGSRSQSSESSPHSGLSVTIGRSHIRPRRQVLHLLGRSPNLFAERDGSSSEELVPTRSTAARDKSSKSFSPWDSPGRDGERKRKRRKRRRERESERSRSPHRESRHRHGDRELWLHSSSSSSDVESRQEKPAGKRKYKTRHLERTARRRSSRKSREREREKERERERSPSVEIIFERRATNTHTRSRRHKKRSRRKERAQNSPTVITIDSDSSSGDHAAHTHHAEDDCHTADYQNTFIDDDKDEITSDIDLRDHNNYDNERITDYSDHTIDYQERVAEFSDRAAEDKDCFTHSGDDDDSKDQNRATAFTEPTTEHGDSVAGVSRQSSDFKYRTGGEKDPDHQDHVGDVSNRAADYKRIVPDGKRNSGEKKDGVTDVSASTADSKVNDLRLTQYQVSHLDVNSPDDFNDTRNRAELNTSVLDMLNLEHCLVDTVQPIRRADEEELRVETPLSDTRLLELQEGLSGGGGGGGGGTPRNSTVNQPEAELVTYGDQSEGE